MTSNVSIGHKNINVLTNNDFEFFDVGNTDFQFFMSIKAAGCPMRRCSHHDGRNTNLTFFYRSFGLLKCRGFRALVHIYKIDEQLTQSTRNRRRQFDISPVKMNNFELCLFYLLIFRNGHTNANQNKQK